MIPGECRPTGILLASWMGYLPGRKLVGKITPSCLYFFKKMNSIKNRKPLSIQILIDHLGITRSDLKRMGIPASTLHDVIYANENISHNTLIRIGKALGTDGYIHWLHALDRLYVLSRCRAIIRWQNLEIPNFIPTGIHHLLVNFHPIFQRENHKTLRSYIKKFYSNISNFPAKVNYKLEKGL